jgi:hypothetical protein
MDCVAKMDCVAIFAEGVGVRTNPFSVAAIGQRFDAAGVAPYKILHINLFTVSVRVTLSQR